MSRRVAVVGAGPAGIAAAVTAAESGCQVTLVDENPAPGGQIWRGEGVGPWLDRLARVRVARLFESRVVAAATGELVIERADRVVTLAWDRLVLATGSREVFLPFPGWDLPGVTGAGGLQALIKSGLRVRNKRVVVAGSGPLLLAVAHLARARGADVLAVLEQAPWTRLARFARTVAARPEKWAQALSMSGLPLRAGSWITRIEPGLRVVTNSGAEARCDYVAVGWGLVPNNELARLLPESPNIFHAGASAGGVDLSLIEGEIAGFRAAGGHAEARALGAKLASARAFADEIERCFALRDELRMLPAPDTTVCRCESVAHARLTDMRSWREAKLHTRCGMGPCQGRGCGSATRFLYGWTPDSVRPPVLPARVSTMAGLS